VVCIFAIHPHHPPSFTAVESCGVSSLSLCLSLLSALTVALEASDLCGKRGLQQRLCAEKWARLVHSFSLPVHCIQNNKFIWAGAGVYGQLTWLSQGTSARAVLSFGQAVSLSCSQNAMSRDSLCCGCVVVEPITYSLVVSNVSIVIWYFFREEGGRAECERVCCCLAAAWWTVHHVMA
jgi:hypothetical protein